MNHSIIVHVGPGHISDRATDNDAERVARLMASWGWRVSVLNGINDGQGASEEDWQEAMAAFDRACKSLGIHQWQGNEHCLMDRTTAD